MLASNNLLSIKAVAKRKAVEGGQDDGRISSGNQQSRERLRRDGLDPAIIVYAPGLFIHSCDFTYGAAHRYEAFIGLLSWTYLLGLSILILSEIQISPASSNQIWIHSILLYGLHWSITAIVHAKVILNDGIPS